MGTGGDSKKDGGECGTRRDTPQATTKTLGDAAESLALRWLQARGLRLAARNYRVAQGPRARGGEIDLVMHDTDGTLVFIEVRSRSGGAQGGSAASVTWAKQRSIVLAARHYVMRLPTPPPCRFDVVAVDGGQVQWLQAAFDAG